MLSVFGVVGMSVALSSSVSVEKAKAAVAWSESAAGARWRFRQFDEPFQAMCRDIIQRSDATLAASAALGKQIEANQVGRVIAQHAREVALRQAAQDAREAIDKDAIARLERENEALKLKLKQAEEKAAKPAEPKPAPKP